MMNPTGPDVSMALGEALRRQSRAPRRRPVLLVMNKLMVGAYKSFGFLVLTAILLGLACFLFGKVFFLFNRTWIVPAVISPSDDRVLRLNAEILQEATLRDKLLADRAHVEAKVRDADRRIAAGEALEASLNRVVETEALTRRTERRRIRGLTTALAQTRQEADSAVREFAALSRQALEEQYTAGLTTRDRYVAGNLQLSQLAQANLALAEKDSELSARHARMKRETDSLLTSTKGLTASGPLDADSLRLRQDAMRATLEVEKAKDDKKAYTTELEVIDRSVRRYEDLLKSLSDSPVLMARNGRLMTAFVPYSNLGSAGADSGVYACRLVMLLCRRVGSVGQALPGEVSVHSPISSRNERGVMVELKLDGGGQAVREEVLFVNRAPLLL